MKVNILLTVQSSPTMVTFQLLTPGKTFTSLPGFFRGEWGGGSKYRNDLFTSLPLAAIAVLISPKCFISVK